MTANMHLKYKHTVLDERIVKQINRGRWCKFNLLFKKKHKQENKSAAMI